MMIITVNPNNPQVRVIRKIVEGLEKGGVIGYPTDTVYGVGCDLFNPEAIREDSSIEEIRREETTQLHLFRFKRYQPICFCFKLCL